MIARDQTKHNVFLLVWTKDKCHRLFIRHTCNYAEGGRYDTQLAPYACSALLRTTAEMPAQHSRACWASPGPTAGLLRVSSQPCGHSQLPLHRMLRGYLLTRVLPLPGCLFHCTLVKEKPLNILGWKTASRECKRLRLRTYRTVCSPTPRRDTSAPLRPGCPSRSGSLPKVTAATVTATTGTATRRPPSRPSPAAARCCAPTRAGPLSPAVLQIHLFSVPSQNRRPEEDMTGRQLAPTHSYAEPPRRLPLGKLHPGGFPGSGSPSR